MGLNLSVLPGTASAEGIPTAGNAFYLIKPAHANGRMCLDVAHNSARNPSPVVQGRCTGTANQLWTTERVARGVYLIHPLHARHMCLNEMWGGDGQPWKAAIRDCGSIPHSDEYDQWKFHVGPVGATEMIVRPQIGQRVQFRNSTTTGHDCLDVAHASSAHAATVYVTRCWNGLNQQWSFERA
ncbi:RICIN domain-containing protein [Streptomyces sp. NRRL S-1314]|uniref:RICIN domain-containing protein n=1 Tax=Streptomyces sp. NRRL S-1314 TaxID=1463882 RepID=UPI00131E530C|nr:RICIN domain-containing protein [Streptomyces sp. NRRL S-1314]